MSKFSGRHDLYDHMMLTKMYERNGRYESDEFECFSIFKQRTGGKIYQVRRVRISPLNRDLVMELCPEFSYRTVTNTKKDRRFKLGRRSISHDVYTYNGKDCTLDDLNREGVLVEIPICFDTIFDLIPYYPYPVTCAVSDGEHSKVYIPAHSLVDEQYDLGLITGAVKTPIHYHQRLQAHYQEVCEHYYFFNIAERTHVEPITVDASTGIGMTRSPIDPLHPIKYVWDETHEPVPHWGDPEFVEGNCYKIDLRNLDGEMLYRIKHDEVRIQYVEACEMPKVFR